MYASIGRDILPYEADLDKPKYPGNTGWSHVGNMFPLWRNSNQLRDASDGQGNGWWLGLTGEVTAWNPFRLSFEFDYGSVDMGSYAGTEYDIKRAGWFASVMAEYKLDFMTPGLGFWYASGDDNDAKDGSEMLPTIKASSGLTSFGQDASGFNTPGNVFTSTAGTWGILAQLKDISFVEDLKHTLRVAYYRGTNDKDMTEHNGGLMKAPLTQASYFYLTDKDSAWEFNLDSSYQIYKNLSVGVELGYIRLDLSENAWGKKVENNSDDLYKVAVGLRYTF